MNKFKKQLKKFGMEKEFQDWIRKGQPVQLGDRVCVLVNPHTLHCDYYRPGDVGFVKEIYSEDDLVIRFDSDSHKPGAWFIGRKNFDII